MTRRTPWQLLIAGALLVVLAILATVQYRWLGDVSEAERERLRTSLHARAAELADNFDRELTHIFVTFHVDLQAFDSDPAGTLADAFARARTSSGAPAPVKGVYVFDGAGKTPWTLQQLDVERRTLVPGEWPDALASWHRSSEALSGPGGLAPTLVADTLDSRTPALIIGLPRAVRAQGPNPLSLRDPASLVRIVIVLLDQDALRRALLEPLVARTFGTGRDVQYYVTIVRRANPSQVIFQSDPAVQVDQKSADVEVPVFTLQRDEIQDLAARYRPLVPAKGQLSITIVRRGEGVNGAHLMTASDTSGAWQLLVRGKAGSLDALVARSRRRNIAISLAVLALLAASFVLIIVSAGRQQRLARQQMEFVAAVSHELRTPLAVICSAGENLADGVVADPPQVRRYGSLIETEGRRLGDMVERVMQFAGISSGVPARAPSDVDVAQVLADAVSGVSAEARDRGVTVTVHPNGPLPSVSGDADSLRSAFQNIVGNAVKYSPAGAAVDVTTGTTGGRVQIRVADRGLGIDAADLPHIFKPFYRGRRAVDAQVRGSGVGLSVVRHVIDTHHGTIDVDSRAGEGTVVTVKLLPSLNPHAPGPPASAARI